MVQQLMEFHRNTTGAWTWDSAAGDLGGGGHFTRPSAATALPPAGEGKEGRSSPEGPGRYLA